MIAIRVCPTCKRKFEARVGEPQTYCEECLELKTMSESSVCSWFFDDDDFAMTSMTISISQKLEKKKRRRHKRESRVDKYLTRFRRTRKRQDAWTTLSSRKH